MPRTSHSACSVGNFLRGVKAEDLALLSNHLSARHIGTGPYCSRFIGKFHETSLSLLLFSRNILVIREVCDYLDVSKSLQISKRISALRARFYEVYTGKEALLQMISEVEIADEVFNSNAIENSTLTLEDTEKILLEIDLDRYISERELFEARNLARVVEYVEKKSSEQRLDLDAMCFFHKLLLSNIRDGIAGRFRNEEEWVRVGNHIAAAPNLVTGLLDTMFSQYHADPMISIAKRIATFHLTFESIHPFVDGNGRIGRVLNNYLLRREGYVPITIRFASRDDY